MPYFQRGYPAFLFFELDNCRNGKKITSIILYICFRWNFTYVARVSKGANSLFGNFDFVHIAFGSKYAWITINVLLYQIWLS